MQVLLIVAVPFAANSQIFYATCIALIMFCEGGHFTLVPNVLKKIFGSQNGTAIYGICFSYTGLCAVLVLFLQEYFLNSDSARSFTLFFLLTGILSLIALVLLLTVFVEDKYKPKRNHSLTDEMSPTALITKKKNFN